jgi:hypothetical protein
MKRIRTRDRKFLLMMGATVLLIAVFFFAGVQVGRMVTGGARKVDTGKIEAMIDTGELSSKPARYGRVVETDDTDDLEVPVDPENTEEPNGNGDESGSTP